MPALMIAFSPEDAAMAFMSRFGIDAPLLALHNPRDVAVNVGVLAVPTILAVRGGVVREVMHGTRYDLDDPSRDRDCG